MLNKEYRNCEWVTFISVEEFCGRVWNNNSYRYDTCGWLFYTFKMDDGTLLFYLDPHPDKIFLRLKYNTKFKISFYIEEERDNPQFFDGGFKITNTRIINKKTYMNDVYLISDAEWFTRLSKNLFTLSGIDWRYSRYEETRVVYFRLVNRTTGNVIEHKEVVNLKKRIQKMVEDAYEKNLPLFEGLTEDSSYSLSSEEFLSLLKKIDEYDNLNDKLNFF